jgi:hypothetical protein
VKTTPHTTSLGNDILIFDLETRPLKSTISFQKSQYTWRAIDKISARILNHNTYSRIHGYSYKLVQPTGFTDRHNTWIKLSASSHELANYEFIVFLDADAVFHPCTY